MLCNSTHRDYTHRTSEEAYTYSKGISTRSHLPQHAALKCTKLSAAQLQWHPRLPLLEYTPTSTAAPSYNMNAKPPVVSHHLYIVQHRPARGVMKAMQGKPIPCQNKVNLTSSPGPGTLSPSRRSIASFHVESVALPAGTVLLSDSGSKGTVSASSG